MAGLRLLPAASAAKFVEYYVTTDMAASRFIQFLREPYAYSGSRLS